MSQFEFGLDFSFGILSQFEFLSFVIILVFFSFVTNSVLEFGHDYFFLKYCNIFLKVCHKLSFSVYSPDEFLRFVTIRVFEVCHN